MGEKAWLGIGCTLCKVECGTCGLIFGLEEKFHDAHYKSGRHFYCPNGCHVSWSATEADRLRAQLKKETERVAYWQNRANAECEAKKHEARRASALKGKVTAIRNRVGNGVCPCCNRSFTNLRRHMATKHPAWKGDDE